MAEFIVGYPIDYTMKKKCLQKFKWNRLQDNVWKTEYGNLWPDTMSGNFIHVNDSTIVINNVVIFNEAK